MNLLYLMTEPFGVGGVQSDILSLTTELVAAGHEVYVATTPGVLLDELQSRGASFCNIGFHFRNPVSLWRSARAVHELVIREKIDLVAPQSVRSAIVAFISLRLMRGYQKRVPVVVTIHNIHTAVHFRYVGWILDRCADYVIFESNYERRRVTACGLPEDKSVVIHSGIDLERYSTRKPDLALVERYGIDPSIHLVFGIVARLSEEKGHQYLIAAFADLVQRVSQARLMIVGDGPLFESTRKQAGAFGIEDRVVFTGMQRNIPDLLSLMHVFVLASTRESFPLSAREAMAAGLAVIAPDVGGCAEVVDDQVTGYLYPATDVSALTQCMLRIASDDNATRFGAAGLEKARRLYSSRAWARGDESVYLRFVE